MWEKLNPENMCFHIFLTHSQASYNFSRPIQQQERNRFRAQLCSWGKTSNTQVFHSRKQVTRFVLSTEKIFQGWKSKGIPYKCIPLHYAVKHTAHSCCFKTKAFKDTTKVSMKKYCTVFQNTIHLDIILKERNLKHTTTGYSWLWSMWI